LEVRLIPCSWWRFNSGKSQFTLLPFNLGIAGGSV